MRAYSLGKSSVLNHLNVSRHAHVYKGAMGHYGRTGKKCIAHLAAGHSREVAIGGVGATRLAV